MEQLRVYAIYSNDCFVTSRVNASSARKEAGRRRRLGYQNVEVREVENYAVLCDAHNEQVRTNREIVRQLWEDLDRKPSLAEIEAVLEGGR